MFCLSLRHICETVAYGYHIEVNNDKWLISKYNICETIAYGYQTEVNNDWCFIS